MPQIRFRRAAIKKYLDAFDEQSRAFDNIRSRLNKEPLKGFEPYTETASGLPDQVIDSAGQMIYGPFLTSYWNNDLSGSATMFDDALKSLTANGAFVSRFQTIKFRQFDEALYLMQSQFLPTPFNETDEWQNVVTNTTYILENFNSRLNLMNTGLQAIFQSSVFVSQSVELDYLSNTNWPNSTWTELPLPLTTSDTNNFMSATFFDDANVIPLESMNEYIAPASALVTVDTLENYEQFQFVSQNKSNVLIVSTTNNIASEAVSFEISRYSDDLGGFYPVFLLTGLTTYTAGGVATTINSGNSSILFPTPNTDENFVVRMTLTAPAYVADFETMYMRLMD